MCSRMRTLWAPLVGLALVVSQRPVQAEPPEPQPRCGQRGKVPFDKDVVLTDAGGHKLARFSGGESAVTLLAPPSSEGAPVHIETGTGRGSFRINGFVKPSELLLYTSVRLPVVSGHVWLTAGTRVSLVGTSGGKVRLQKSLETPFQQQFGALGDCSALSFTSPGSASPPIPGAARVYLLKGEKLELFADMPPTGAAIFTLKRSPLVDNVPFFSTEQRGGFVHVGYLGEVEVDAWARASELTPLPRGETSDLPPGSYTLTSPPELRLSPPPRVVHTTKELPLRLRAKDGEPPIGVIEADTDVFVMDTVAGWASVLPKSLHVLPAGEQSFWVKAAGLGP